MLDKKNAYINLSITAIISIIFWKLLDNVHYAFTGLSFILKILQPFILAFVFAYALNPIMSFFERKTKVKRGAAIAITYALIICFFVVFIIFALPQLSNSLMQLLNNIPIFLRSSKVWVEEFLKNNPTLNQIDIHKLIMDNLNTISSYIQSGISNLSDAIINRTVSATLSITNLVLGFIIAIYVLNDKEKFLELGKKIIYIVFKKKYGNHIINFINVLHDTLSTYIGAKMIDSSIIALICFTGFCFIKPPYIPILTLIVGVTNMIPYFGPLIGMIPCFFITLFYNPFTAIYVILFIFALQQFDGFYLDPKIIGKKVGLSPLLVTFAVTIGGSLFGVIGMILGVPVVAVMKTYVNKFIERCEKKQSDENYATPTLKDKLIKLENKILEDDNSV